MTRRNLLFGLFAGASVTAQSTHINAPVIANEFANAFNTWAMLRNENEAKAPGSYSWPAKRQWDKEVKPKFHNLDLGLKNE